MFAEAGIMKGTTPAAIRKTFTNFIDLYDGQSISIRGRDVRIDAKKIKDWVMGRKGVDVDAKFLTEKVKNYLTLTNMFINNLLI